MPVELKHIAAVLGEGFELPRLEVLDPNNKNYACSLLQPAGPIFADSNRIGHHNQTEADRRCRRFLMDAAAAGAHLVSTPEYCTPWETIRFAIEGDCFPAEGSIWVLGAESVTRETLVALKQEWAPVCEVLFEDIPNSTGNYMDPLVYLFQCRRVGGGLRRVAIVQFKTAPSRDEYFFENEHLICGNTIYLFENADGLLRLCSIICSDSFAISGNEPFLRKIFDRSIVLHIQLNPDPRHADYSAYRRNAFRQHADISNSDLICLNWASDILQLNENGKQIGDWKNIAGSTWYVPSSRSTTIDSQVESNHEKGLYFSCLEPKRRNALLINYEDGVYEFHASKPLATGAGVVVNTTGPLLKQRRIWTTASGGEWAVAATAADSGYSSLVSEGKFSTAMAEFGPSPLGIERGLALTSGKISYLHNWYDVGKLDSCLLLGNEAVRRITFAQDRCEAARQFRHARMASAAELDVHLQQVESWPPQVGNLKGAKLKWLLGRPNCNVYPTSGEPATVVFLGLRPSRDEISAAVAGLFELLRVENAPTRSRMCVCYLEGAELVFAQVPFLTRFDLAADDSTDISEVADDESEPTGGM